MIEMHVPAQYLGVWQRRVLETGDGRRDAESTVYWLQARRWHGDIRVPARRPDFAGIESLAQCSRTQLEWLCRQQGFAGVTEVTGDICRWRRQIDFQLSEANDVGRMVFAGERLEEFGVEADYYELWERLPESRGASRVLRLLDSDGADMQPATFALFSGDCFMVLRGRRVPVEQARLIRSRVEEGVASETELAEYADFEISFGHKRESEWRIELSTLPWREGQTAFMAGALSAAVGGVVYDATALRGWRVMERSGAADEKSSAAPER